MKEETEALKREIKFVEQGVKLAKKRVEAREKYLLDLKRELHEKEVGEFTATLGEPYLSEGMALTLTQEVYDLIIQQAGWVQDWQWVGATVELSNISVGDGKDEAEIRISNPNLLFPGGGSVGGIPIKMAQGMRLAWIAEQERKIKK